MPKNIDGIKANTKKIIASKKHEKTRIVKEIPQETFIPVKKKQPIRFGAKYLVFPVLFLLIVALAYFLLSKFDHTSVEIVPRIENISLNQTINAFRNPNMGQFGFDIMATSHITSMEIMATGQEKIGHRASGEIVIYNKFSKEPQRLAPFTRFETPDGKIFKLDDNGVIIPGFKSESEPGFMEITVYADLPGEEYNIGLTDFTIPGYREINVTERYNNIYALSKTPMTGGSIENVPVISDSDRIVAEKELQNGLKKRLMQIIERQKAKEFLVVPDSIKFSFENSILEEKDGKTLISQKGLAVAILISKSNIEKYIEDIVLKEESGDGIEILSTEKLQISVVAPYEIESAANQNNINIRLTGSVFVGWNVDPNILQVNLLGLSRDDAIKYIQRNPGVEGATVRIYPFWEEKISIEREKLNIKLEDFYTK